MYYVKIYDENAKPLGVVSQDSFQPVQGGNRYVKIHDGNGNPIGVVCIDAEFVSSEATRLVTLYNEKMLPVGVISIEYLAQMDSESTEMTITAISDASGSNKVDAEINDMLPDTLETLGLIVYGTNMDGTWTYEYKGSNMSGVVNQAKTQVLFDPQAQDYIDINSAGVVKYNGSVVLGFRDTPKVKQE